VWVGQSKDHGPRLIQLGIAILRGYAVPPYNYVHHKAVTPETLGDEAKAQNEKREDAALALVGQGVGSG
jgi:hypothetical protein